MAHPSLSPYQAFEAADGPLMLGVGNDAQWRRFCAAAGLGEYAQDERFATNAARLANFDLTAELVADRVRTRTVDAWLELLRAAGVPCSPIHDLAQALAHPQFAVRELVVKTRHERIGEVRNMGFPAKFNGQAREAQRPAPMLGEHSEEILRELGYPEQAIEEMAEDGAVGLAYRETIRTA